MLVTKNTKNRLTKWAPSKQIRETVKRQMQKGMSHKDALVFAILESQGKTMPDEYRRSTK